MIKGATVKQQKEPISEKTVYRIMVGMPFAVGGIFLIKDLLIKDLDGAKVIAIMFGVLLAMLVGLKLLHIKQDVCNFVVSIFVLFVVFIVSMNSGEYYSDDYDDKYLISTQIYCSNKKLTR